MAGAVTSKSRRGRKPPGRKGLAVPRERRCVLMSARTRAAIVEWQQAERLNGKGSFSFPDALDEMVAIASYYAADRNAAHRLQPLATVLNGLHGRTVPEHVRIEPNGGKQVRCSRCRASHTIVSRRFSGMLRELTTFVREHEHASDSVEHCPRETCFGGD